MNPTRTSDNETVAETFARGQQTLNRLQGNVSAAELANPPAEIKPPAPLQPQPNDGTLNTLVQNVSNNTQQFIQSQSEEAARARELADLLGSQTFDGAGQRQQLNEQFGIPQNLQRLQDLQTQLARANTESGITQTRIQGAAGQTLATAQREVTQEQRENAVRTAGVAAEAAVLQGNIETASTLINQAMTDFYADRQLQNQNMIQQLQYFQGIADDQTAQLLRQEERKYQEDQANIQRVIANVDAAVSSGAATTEEMRQLTDPRLTDEQRLGVAQNVIARTNAQMRNLEMAQMQASIANTYDQISDRRARLALANQAAAIEIDKENATQAQVNEAKGEKALGMLQSIRELKNHPGFSAAVGPNPLARIEYGAGLGVFQGLFTGNKSEFISEVDRLANTLTLENMDLLKGPATDKDVEIVAASMSRLKNRDVSEAGYWEELTRLEQAAQRIVDNVGITPEQAAFYLNIDPQTMQEVDNIFGGSTTNNSTPLLNWNR